MQTLSEKDIIVRIRRREAFEAKLEGGALFVKIRKYRPAICTAIHSGDRLRAELAEQCSLTAQQRRYEEDPFTDSIISTLPITLIAKDSRYEYDLNRPLAHCVYQRAWNQQVWSKPLTAAQISLSHEKHKQFYRILDALIDQLEQNFKVCILFDIHSYNYQRIGRETPVFNLGTEQIDMVRWGQIVNCFQKKLCKITVRNSQPSAALNDVFRGRGYLIGHVNSRFVNSLVIPTEVKKVFMNESSGELHPLVLDGLKEGMKQAITDTTAYFSYKHIRKPRARRHEMSSTTFDPAVVA